MSTDGEKFHEDPVVGEGLGGDGVTAEGAGRREGGGELGDTGETGVMLVGTEHDGGSISTVELVGADAAGQAVAFLRQDRHVCPYHSCPILLGKASAVSHPIYFH